jgi:hypothetical protein
MTTYRDLITSSLRSIGVLHSGETPSAEEANDSLDALNEMLNAWIYEGVNLEHTTATSLNSTVPYPDDHLGPIRWNLCVRLAPEFGIAVTAEIAALAQQGFNQLQRAYADPLNLDLDPALNAIYDPNQYR